MVGNEARHNLQWSSEVFQETGQVGRADEDEDHPRKKDLPYLLARASEYEFLQSSEQQRWTANTLQRVRKQGTKKVQLRPDFFAQYTTPAGVDWNPIQPQESEYRDTAGKAKTRTAVGAATIPTNADIVSVGSWGRVIDWHLRER